MPWGNRTGPWGRGPRTGRGAGYCAGYPIPGHMNPDVPGYGRGRGFDRGYGRGMGVGRGRGFGRGFGRGWQRFEREPYPDPYYPPESVHYPYYGPEFNKPDPEEEKTYLENIIESLEKEMKAIKDRLKELTTTEKKK